MRVDQAGGGTNRPGIAASMFAMPAGMRMRYDIPAADLSSCITGYAIYIAEDTAPMVNWYLPAQAMITILLDAGPMSVTFRNGGHDGLDQACVWGPTSHAFRTLTTGGISVGIGLTAAGWAHFTTRPADECRDRVLPLSDFVGEAVVAELVGALEALTDDADIAPLLDAMLPRLFAGDHPEAPITGALGRLILTDGVINVGDVAARLGIGTSELRRIATRYFGMMPKALLTRARFIRSFTNWLMTGEHASYAGIDSSYFDVAHFLLDARNYLDTTPRRFARRETAYLRASLRARSAVIGAPTHVLHIPRPASDQPHADAAVDDAS